MAAHECGHAIQDQKQYGPLVLRSTLVPLANFGSSLSWPVFFAGLIFSIPPLLTAGIILFSLAVLFQLVTLPVEFNASSRALKVLEGGQDPRNGRSCAGGKKVLRAAALTYVASAGIVCSTAAAFDYSGRRKTRSMTKPVNIREIASGDPAWRSQRRRRYSHIVLREVLEKYQYLEKRDRAFISRES